MTDQTDETTEPTGSDDRSTKLRKAYTAATARLRESHRDEFDGLYSEEAQNLGVTYTPRLTPQQKAAKDLQDLLSANPDLGAAWGLVQGADGVWVPATQAEGQATA